MNNTQDRVTKQIESVNFYKQLDKYSHNPTFTTIFSIFFALILISVAIRPSLSKITQLKSTIDKLAKLDSQLSIKLSILEKLEPKYKKALTKKDLLDFCIPSEPKVETFERQVRYYVQKNDLPFKSLSISAFPIIDSEKKDEILKANKKNSRSKSKEEEVIKALQNFTPLDFSVSLEGDYAKVKSFLFDFQKNIRAIQITAISINQSEDSSLRLSISGIVYYYADKNL